jgi:hypothetical protein
MLIFLLRCSLTLLFVYSMSRALVRYPGLSGGDIIFLLGYALAGSIFVAILWAPVIGAKLSDPLTSALNSETSIPADPNRLVATIRWLQNRRWHRLALLLVFIEGMRHPKLPQPPLLGLRSVKPGSFLEKCFAKEVFKYNNVQNCLYAYKVLTERHGITPRLHQQPEVNLAISNLTREPRPEPAKYKVKSAAAQQRTGRNPRIKLFEP